jgi:RnfABCDGE-type electron transport complex B subunit
MINLLLQPIDITKLFIVLGIIAVIAVVFGALIVVVSKLCHVEEDERISAVSELLAGANCGGCGYAGCEAYAEAVVKGEAKPNACTAGGDETAKAVADIMGLEAMPTIRMRAQVMCSGTAEYAQKKYVYDGAHDCISAAKMNGGDKLCPNGCIGLGTCVTRCKFGAITVVDGVAVVDYRKCTGCGICAASCPKGLIKLIPYRSAHWVGCMSRDKGKTVRDYCKVGCIACGLCVRVCEYDAIRVEDNIAHIDYDKCADCGMCVDKCPRKVIWSCESQKDGLVIMRIPDDIAVNAE